MARRLTADPLGDDVAHPSPAAIRLVDTERHGSIAEAAGHAHRLVGRRAQIECDALGTEGFGEHVPDDRPPEGLEAVHADQVRADMQAIGRDAICRPEHAPQCGRDNEAAIGSLRRGRENDAASSPSWSGPE